MIHSPESTPRSSPPQRGPLKSRIVTLLAGALIGAAAVVALSTASTTSTTDDSSTVRTAGFMVSQVQAALASAPAADLGDGDYLFLPNRRTVWVVNRRHGRIANYHFRDDQEQTVLRSRVVTLDPKDFPQGDTYYCLSDRNLTDVLWVCNVRTGDVQLWRARADGNVVAEGQVVTSVDLLPRD